MTRRYAGDVNRQIHVPSLDKNHLELRHQMFSLQQKGLNGLDSTGFPMVVSPPAVAAVMAPFNSIMGQRNKAKSSSRTMSTNNVAAIMQMGPATTTNATSSRQHLFVEDKLHSSRILHLPDAAKVPASTSAANRIKSGTRQKQASSLKNPQ